MISRRLSAIGACLNLLFAIGSCSYIIYKKLPVEYGIIIFIFMFIYSVNCVQASIPKSKYSDYKIKYKELEK